RLMWSKRDRPPEQAAYECRACLTLIEEHHKTMMLAQGEWRPERPEADPRVRGYPLSALYSPVGWLSWGDIALDFVAVHRDPERHRVFINTVLGETWQD